MKRIMKKLKIMALCTQHTNQQTLKTPIIQKNKRCQYLVPPLQV